MNGFTANIGEQTNYRVIGQAWAEDYGLQYLLLPEGDSKHCTEVAVVKCKPVAVRLLSSGTLIRRPLTAAYRKISAKPSRTPFYPLWNKRTSNSAAESPLRCLMHPESAP